MSKNISRFKFSLKIGSKQITVLSPKNPKFTREVLQAFEDFVFRELLVNTPPDAIDEGRVSWEVEKDIVFEDFSEAIKISGCALNFPELESTEFKKGVVDQVFMQIIINEYLDLWLRVKQNCEKSGISETSLAFLSK
ncbi:MAG: hypothetical protein AAB488_00090 [Patescibacteria group bacterium]